MTNKSSPLGFTMGDRVIHCQSGNKGVVKSVIGVLLIVEWDDGITDAISETALDLLVERRELKSAEEIVADITDALMKGECSVIEEVANKVLTYKVKHDKDGVFDITK